MKVIVSVQSKRGSSRGLVHYLAHSKIDMSKEQSVGRELFNNYSDSIDVKKTNSFLKSGTSNKRPANDELHHLVLSLKPEDFEKLGVDEKERRRSVKEIIRHAMSKLEEAIGAEKLTWAASIHRNTQNPHVHIALQKQFFDRDLKSRSLTKVPRECLPHYERSGSEKVFAAGVLIKAATEKLDEIILEKSVILEARSISVTEINRSENVRDNESLKELNSSEDQTPKDPNSQINIVHEREILARALLARYFLDRSEEKLESIAENGKKRRFLIFDAITNQKRRMSLLTLERRAADGASQEVKRLKISDPNKIAELRENFIGSELDQNLNGIRQIRAILIKTAAKEELIRQQREDVYRLVRPEADVIRASYRRENRKLPTPLLTKDELDILQEISLEKGDARSMNYFERVRTELVNSGELQPRTKEDIQRIKAKQFVQELRLRLLQKQQDSFNDRKLFSTFEIDGEKWSLAKIEKLIEKEPKTDTTFIGKVKKIFTQEAVPSNEFSRSDLLNLRTKTIQKLEERNGERAHSLKQEKNTERILQSIYKNDPTSDKQTHNPKFNADQLAVIESLAFRLKLPEVYADNWNEQKSFVLQAGNDSAAALKNTATALENGNILAAKQEALIAGRAIAREVMCEVELAKATDSLRKFQKYKHLHKFEVSDERTGEARFVNLKEVEFRQYGSFLDQAIEYFTEDRERRRTRNTIKTKIKERNAKLKSEVTAAKELIEITSREAGYYKKGGIFGLGSLTHNPIFTPQETAALELRIKQTENLFESMKLKSLLEIKGERSTGTLSKILGLFSSDKENAAEKENVILATRFPGNTPDNLEKTAAHIQHDPDVPKNSDSRTDGRDPLTAKPETKGRYDRPRDIR